MLLCRRLNVNVNKQNTCSFIDPAVRIAQNIWIKLVMCAFYINVRVGVKNPLYQS